MSEQHETHPSVATPSAPPPGPRQADRQPPQTSARLQRQPQANPRPPESEEPQGWSWDRLTVEEREQILCEGVGAPSRAREAARRAAAGLPEPVPVASLPSRWQSLVAFLRRTVDRLRPRRRAR
jgi:hypothetical protein